MASVGIDVSKVYLLVDENTQTITVGIPDAPKLLDIVSQGYWVKQGELKNSYAHQTVVYQTKAKKGKQNAPTPQIKTREHTFQISPKRLEATFRQNQFEPQEIQNQLAPLRANEPGLDKVRHILKKVIEPMLVLPGSCYTVYMVFKGKVSKVHEVSCR